MKGGYRARAGRPGWHAKTGHTRQIDVRRLHREGYLNSSYRMVWTWSDSATITLSTSPHTVTLNYRYKDHTGAWRSVDQPVTVTRTPCHYGKDRPWFLCPHCDARVAVLYLWNLPVCRRCAKLVYSSQSQDAFSRSWQRTRKIEARLKGDAKEWNYLKPKGMHWATFHRLTAAYLHEEQWRNADFVERACRMFPGHFL
jgi:hypothetical protein